MPLGYAVSALPAATRVTPYHADEDDGATMLIETHTLTLSRGREPLLHDLSWGLAAGERWALIGPNGSGKSTLLAALAGDPWVRSAGSVRRAPGVWLSCVMQGEGVVQLAADASLHDLALAACAPLLALAGELANRAEALGSHPSAAELEAYGHWQALFEERGGYNIDARLAANLNQLGLAQAALHEARHASGGERRRARLAGALSSGAEVLLLDEPTNHLDLPTRDALAERLLCHRGGVLFASHDRAWIDRVATHVLRLSDGRAQAYRGGYQRTHAQLQAGAQAQQKAERLQRQRRAALESMAAELRAQGHRGAQVRRKRAERELAGLPSATPSKRSDPQLALRASPAGGLLARLQHLRVEGVVAIEELRLHAGERIALIGPSGVGKSTLLGLIAGERTSDDPRAASWWRGGVSLWHADQHGRGIPDEITPLAALEVWVSRAQAQGLLAQVRLGAACWTRPAANLSGGERARAGLALLMARKPDVVLLDEPTNDLDLPLIEALEQALQASRATLVVASHDAQLIEALQAEVVTIEAGQWVRWRGGLGGWRRGQRRLEVAASAVALLPEAPPAEEEIDWDALRARAEEVLLDPMRWGERERERWLARRREAEEGMLQAWQASMPPAAPPYSTREGGWRVSGEPTPTGMRVWLEDDAAGASLQVRLLHSDAGRIGHLLLTRAHDRSLTRFAEQALVRAAARLALYFHHIDAAQIAGDHAPPDFEALTPGWWVWRRYAMERAEGWRTPAPPTARRRRRRRRARVT